MQRASKSISNTYVVKNCLQEGITIDSYTYVEVLQRCCKQKDLTLTKQIHDCIKKSRMELNMYMTNNLFITL